MLESFQKRALNIGIKCRSQYIHSDVCRSWERASELPPSSLLSVLSVDGLIKPRSLIKLRMQRVFIGALCRQLSSCNQSERDAIFGRDSYERKLSNHHDQGRRQGATAIIEFFSVTRTRQKNFEGARGRLCSSKGGACATAQRAKGTMASPSLRVSDVGPCAGYATPRYVS